MMKLMADKTKMKAMIVDATNAGDEEVREPPRRHAEDSRTAQEKPFH